MKKKLKTFTFRDGVTVVGVLEKGKMNPYEYKSLVSVEKYSYKLLEKGIYTVVIKSYGNPYRYYLQVIDYDINNISEEKN